MKSLFDAWHVPEMHRPEMSSFNRDISKWDVARVTIMAYMFASASSFNGDISKWDVSRVTNMGAMFWDASSFNCDISAWEVSNVKDMYGMFAGASSFEQTLCGDAWVNSTATKKRMFDGSPGAICPTGKTTSTRKSEP